MGNPIRASRINTASRSWNDSTRIRNCGSSRERGTRRPSPVHRRSMCTACLVFSMASVQPDVRRIPPRSESDTTCEGKCFVDILEVCMRFEKFSFGSIQDRRRYQHDVVIDRRDVRKRKKRPPKKFREEFAHTPVSIEEKIPWQCHRLIIGTGTGALPGDE